MLAFRVSITIESDVKSIRERIKGRFSSGPASTQPDVRAKQSGRPLNYAIGVALPRRAESWHSPPGQIAARTPPLIYRHAPLPDIHKMDEVDPFRPEDVFNLFPTAFPPLNPKVDEPVEEPGVHVEASSSPLNTTAMFNFTFSPNNSWIFGETEDRIILPLLLSMIGMCSLVGNGIVLIVIVGFRRMRTGPNLMLLNITISDLVFMAFSIPSAIITHATPEGTGLAEALSGNVCKFVHYIIFVCVYVTIYSLVVACVFRFFGEYMSTKNSTLLSRGNAIVSCIVIWAAFLASHLNILVQEEGMIFQEPFICVHSDNLADTTKVRTLWVTFLTCAFLLPLITICGLSAVILHSQTRQKPADDDYESAQNNANDMRNKREMTMVIMASMVIRVVCWIPIQVFVMVDVFGVVDITEMYRKAEMLGVCLAFAGTCVNPLIYNCASLDFRIAFNDALKRVGCNCSDEPPGKDDFSDMNETIMSIISDSSNHINYA